MTDDARLEVLVSGRVQGVGFRHWVRQQAQPLNLAGSATNRPDGRVEVVAEGRRSDCDAQITALEGSATPGHVTDVVPTWSGVRGEPPGFRVG